MLTDLDLFTAAPSQVLAELRHVEPGPLLMSLLLTLDPARLSADDALTFVELHEQVAAWWAAMQVKALVAVGCEGPTVDEIVVLDRRPGVEAERHMRLEEVRREELAAALRIAPATAQDRIDTARLLVGPLAESWSALQRGEITTGHVRIVVEGAARLPGAVTVMRRSSREDTPQHHADREQFAVACTRLQAAVLPTARKHALSATRVAARRAVLAIDEAGQRRRREQARCTRDVYVVDELDGLSTLVARLSTDRAHAVMSAVDALAHDDRTKGSAGALVGERRAEALVALVLRPSDWNGGVGSTDDRPSVPAVTAHLDLVVDARTLAGLRDPSGLGEPTPLAPTAATARPLAGGGLAELVGVGPVPGELVRDLIDDPNVRVTWRGVVVDEASGHVLDLGRTSYEVSRALRDLVTIRDGTCRFPGCRKRASRCQIDHAEAWEDGGGTDVANLGMLCVRHHQLKTHGGWVLTESAADGSCTWTSPLGRRYRHPAVALLPAGEQAPTRQANRPLIA